MAMWLVPTCPPLFLCRAGMCQPSAPHKASSRSCKQAEDPPGLLDLPWEQIFVGGGVLAWKGAAAPAAGDMCDTWETLVISRLKDLHPWGVGLTLAGLSCLELHRCSAGEEVGTRRWWR